MKRIVIYGTGYLEVVKLIDSINHSKPAYKIMGFINDLPECEGKSFLGYPVIGPKEIIPDLMKQGDICFFNNVVSTLKNRREIVSTLEKNDCEIVSLISPSVDMNYVEIGKGCIIPAGCTVSTNVKIGKYLSCRLNSVISHDVTIKDLVHISPSVTCCGHTVLEEGCYIGAGATIISHVTIGSGAVIGAGATVTEDVPGNVIAAGTPARIIKKEIGEDYRGRGMQR